MSPELQAIFEAVESMGDKAYALVLVYYAKSVLCNLLGYGFGVFLVITAVRLAKYIVGHCTGTNEIIRLCGHDPAYRGLSRAKNTIVELQEKSRELEKLESEKLGFKA